jgi:hypothetical protein
MSLPATFATRTVESTCTVWIGSTNNKGYGQVVVNGVQQLAHRVAYEDAYGPIPEGMTIDHRCRVRNCVRPDRLEAVTNTENGRRGRTASGLQVGDSCINGHELASQGDIYTRPSGTTECRACIRAGNHGRKRPTVRLNASAVAEVHRHSP